MLATAFALGSIFGPMMSPAVAIDQTMHDSEFSHESEVILDVTDSNAYTVTFDNADAGSFQLLESAATEIGAELRTITFEGETGVGQLVVLEGDTTESVTARATQLFAGASTQVPPIVGGLVYSDHQISGLLETEGNLLKISQDSVISESYNSTLLHSLPPIGGVRYSHWDGYKKIKGWPGYSSANDWDAYFPFTYRIEGYNINRCTVLVSQVCLSTAPYAALAQSIKWDGGSHNWYWPEEENWGFEFGAALYNYTLCGSVSDPNFSPGWWLNPTYIEWATNVPIDAAPYQDVNREFDECQTTTHELGIRYPTRLIAGYEYIYYVNSARNSHRTSSTYSSAFQAVHNDCPPGTARDWLTHCMGLNEWVNFPHGSQSATVINAANYFTLPGCARMYAGWSKPLRWFNGQYKEMPWPMDAPFADPSLSFFDGCFTNDW